MGYSETVTYGRTGNFRRPRSRYENVLVGREWELRSGVRYLFGWAGSVLTSALRGAGVVC